MSPTRTGQSVIRAEDVGFLTGAAAYTADLDHPALHDSVHVAFVRSLYAAAKIVAIDVEHARDADGVLAVVTGHDLGELS